ncbi:uncharacterized protein [Amphiura filiformis]|uniref:uncharacterized protein isoform X3 n=1 Tax=Amphiura filiformis TaxID=82378 RepID=UPI003B20CCBD
MALTILLVLGALSGCAYSFSTGPGVENVPSVCGTLDPGEGHGTSTAVGNNPYRVTVSGQTYAVNQQLQVTISSESLTQFRGFIIQARRVSDNSIVGVWTNLPSNTQGISCVLSNAAFTGTLLGPGATEAAANTWGHYNLNSGQVQSHTTVVGSWSTSNSGLGQIYFWAAVVGGPRTNFFTNIRSANINFQTTAQLGIICPNPAAVPAPQGQDNAFVTFQATANGGTPGYSIAYTTQPNTLFNVGTTPVTATVTDAAGGQASCSFNVEVTAALAIQCPNPAPVTLQTGQTSTSVQYSATATGGSGSYQFIYSPQSGSLFAQGTRLVTARVIDTATSAQQSCSFNVVVNPATAGLAIQCPNPSPVTLQTGQSFTSVQYSATATGGTGSYQFTYLPASGSLFVPGIRPVQATVTDTATGAQQSCSFNVEVIAAAAPLAIQCPENRVANAPAGQSGAVVMYSPATASGGVAPYTISYNPSSNFFVVTNNQQTTTTVTATVFDGNNNQQSCTFTVTVNPSTAPLAIQCPENRVAVAPAGQSGAVVTYLPATASGGATPYRIFYDNPSGNFFVVRNNEATITTVTATVFDGNNNQQSCTFTVTVNPSTAAPLAIQCPQNVVEVAPAGQSIALVNYSPATASGGVQPYNPIQYNPSGRFFLVDRTSTITALVIDSNNNQVSCSFTVTVNSATVPLAITCPNPVVTAPQGQSSTVVTFQATASGGTPGYSITYTRQPGSSFNVGATLVTASVSDAAGGQTSCQFNVVVNAATVPLAITCPNPAAVTAQQGQTSAVVTFQATASGGTPGYSITYTRQPGTSFNVGTTLVTASVSDAAGATRTCLFNVVVNAATVPLAITCPNPAAVTAPQGQTSAVVTFQATASGGTPGYSITYTRQPGSSFIVGTTPVTASVSDAAGATRTCLFNVVVNAAGAPLAIQCPITNVQGQFQCGANTGSVTFNRAVVSGGQGNIGAVTYTSNSAVAFFSGVDTNNQVTGTFQVAIGNNLFQVTATVSDSVTSTQCNFFVQLTQAADNADPQILCPDRIQRSVTCGTPFLSVNFPATATDNCPGTPSISYSSTGDTMFTSQTTSSRNMNVGTSTVTATARDASGRTSTCTTVVTITAVGDNANPQIFCTGPIQRSVNCGTPFELVNFPATATDDCPGTPSITYSSFGATVFTSETTSSRNMNAGTSTVTATARDASGRTSTCTTVVTITAVGDNANPQIFCTGPIQRSVNCGTPFELVNFPATATDDCPGTPSITYSSIGATVFTSETTSSRNMNAGTSTVTATARDASGRTSTCTTVVTITAVGDNANPQIFCTGPIQRSVNCGTPFLSVNFPATATDDCPGTPSITYSSFGATVFTSETTSSRNMNVGTSTVTATARDASGRTSSCTTVVSINAADTVPPTIVCPQPVPASVPCGQTNTQVQFTRATANDLCGATTIAYSSGNIQFVEIGNNQVTGTFTTGVTVVTATATDTSQLTNSCQFSVTVEQVDDQDPTITCPDPVSSQVSCGTESTLVEFTGATSTDNCGDALVTYTSGDIQFNSQLNMPNMYSATFPVGVSVVTATATDGSGRTATCPFTVTVNQVDNENPMIECASDIVRSVNCGTSSLQTSFLATATDDCGVVTVRYTSTGATTFNQQIGGTAAMNVGTSFVTATATDGSGKTSTCQTRVDINAVDNANPTITCTGPITQTVPCGTPSFLANFPATATDDCPGTPAISYSSTGATVFTSQATSSRNMNVGTSTVTATATDASGRTSSCTTVVNINEVDGVPPTVTCPQNQQSTLCTGATSTSVTWPAAVAQDNCAAQVMVNYRSAGVTNFPAQTLRTATFNQGTSTVTTTVTDGSQQSVTCTFAVTVSVQNPCANHGCQNGGQCTAFPGSCSQYYCSCPACYYGRFCENRVDQCQNHKCRNGAVCQPQPNSCTDYTCLCQGCNTGNFCEDTYNACAAGNNQCQNGAVCNTLSGVAGCNAFSCQCSGCFTGYRCQLAIPNPCTNNPCQNGGQCTRVQGQCFAYQCTCQSGFTGFNCQTPTPVYINPCNNFPCKNGGSCTCLGNNYYVCSCPPGYGGINCLSQISTSPNFASCTNQPCQNGGQCYNGYDQNSSPNNVYPNQYTCVCGNNFSGTNCGSSTINNPGLNLCTQSSCRNGGQCRNAYYSFSQTTAPFCVCPIGFFGQYCETPYINPCNSNPCQNSGVCTAFNSYFICACAASFSGTTCEITAADSTPPVIICPQNQVATVGQPNQPATVTYPPATATDNSGGFVQISYSNPSGSPFNVGVNTVTVAATDPSGNTATCTFTVTVSVSGVDNTPPTINGCPTAPISATGVTGATVTVSFTAPTCTDASGVQSLTSNIGGATSLNLPVGIALLVEYTCTDNANNVVRCAFTLQVSSANGPVISNCPSSIFDTYTSTPPEFFKTETWTPPTSNGNLVVSTHQPGAIFGRGCTAVYYVYQLGAAQSVCSFSVCLLPTPTTTPPVDTTPPVITFCTPNQQATVSFTGQSAVVTYPPSQASDNSGGVVRLSYSVPSGATFPFGSTTVTVTATDPSGNTAMCTFFVTVSTTTPPVDTTPPVITFCTPNQQATVSFTGQSAVVTYPPSQASDNSGGVVRLSYSVPSGATFPFGSTTVTVTATDPSGNTAMCTFFVTVSTVIGNLMLTCPTPVTVTVQPGNTGATVNYATPTPSGGNPPYSAVSCNRVSGSQFNVGQTIVQCFVTDSAGASAQCNVIVNVNVAGQGLSVTCPPNQMIAIPPGATSSVYFNQNGASATGGTGSYTYSFSHQSSNNFNVGTTQVTVTATDNAGASGTCTFNVVVNAAATASRDEMTPVTQCPDNVVTTAPAGFPSTTVTLPDCEAFNNGGPGYAYIENVVNHSTGSPYNAATNTFNLGTTIVRCNSRDSAGNTGSCVFAVTVNTVGLAAPTVFACDSTTSAISPNTNVVAANGASNAVVTYTAPSSSSTALMTHNNLNTGSTFNLGLTQVIYIFGTTGAQSTCTYYIYVRAFTANPCTSAPCFDPALSQTCFFNNDVFICRPPSSAGRRRRDADVLGCDPLCELNGGICETTEWDPRPSCFYQAVELETESIYKQCQYKPCMNNATCVDTYDEMMDPSYECLCSDGWKGRHCEHHERTTSMEKPDGQMFAYWFVGGALAILSFVVILLAAIVCLVMFKKMTSVPRAEDEKVLVN